MNQTNPPASDQPPAPIVVSVSLAAKRPLVTYLLIGLSLLFFILQLVSKYTLGGDLLFAYLGKINAYIEAGQYWRLLTPALLHASFVHIGFNMYALYVIGPMLEQSYGHGRFLGLYVLSAFAGNVLSFALSTASSLGASTAIFGLVAAQGVFIYRNRLLFRNPRGALVNIATIVLINLVLGLSPGIDNWGHLGGLLGGVIFAWMAGPIWRMEGIAPAYNLVDQNRAGHAWLGAAAVLVSFGFIFIFRLFLK